jgi:hypothetical protein
MADDERTRSIRQKILEIHQNPNLTEQEKAIMQQRILCPVKDLPPSVISIEEATKGLEVSYHDLENEVFGCSHYPRGCKVRAPCCGKFFVCRLCHDENEKHKIDR